MVIQTVADVMTPGVITVRPETDYQHVLNLLIEHEISAVPVVDDSNRVLGIVSEADLATKVEFATVWPVQHGQSQSARRQRAAAAKSVAGTAGELMSAPAVTVDRDASVAAAARRMADAHVKRMPVVDSDGRLIGIVSRRDLLRTHLRSDVQIRADVSDLLADWFRRQPGQIGITVSDGVVTLVGNASDRRQAEHAVLLASSIDGVVAVVDRLTVVDRAKVT